MKKETIIKNLFFIITLVLLKFTIDFIYEQYTLSNKENIKKAVTDYDPSVLDEVGDTWSDCLQVTDYQDCLKVDKSTSKLYKDEMYTFMSGEKEISLKSKVNEDRIVLERKESIKVVKCITNFPKYNFREEVLEIFFTENEKINHYLICTDKYEIIIYKNNNVDKEEINKMIQDSVLLK